MIEQRTIAQGTTAQIILSSEPGVCFRQFDAVTWDRLSAQSELRTHKELLRVGINTMPVYEIDKDNCRIRMSDLSKGVKILLLQPHTFGKFLITLETKV